LSRPVAAAVPTAAEVVRRLLTDAGYEPEASHLENREED
jgi:hypothetical protein